MSIPSYLQQYDSTMNYNGFMEKFISSVNFDVVILHNEQITSFSLVYITSSHSIRVYVVNYMI